MCAFQSDKILWTVTYVKEQSSRLTLSIAGMVVPIELKIMANSEFP